MTPADRLVNAARQLVVETAPISGDHRRFACQVCGREWESGEEPVNHDDDCKWLCTARALAAYDARKRPDVKDVARAMRACEIETAGVTTWLDLARAAMRVMGEEP